MTRKLTYEELEQRIKELEGEFLETKPTKKELQEDEGIRQILKFAPYGIYLIDLSGKIVAANNRGAEHLGKHFEEIIGTTFFDYFPQDVVENRRAKCIGIVKSLKPVNFEDHVGNRWYSNNIFPVLNNQGKLTHLAIYGADITDFKLKEEALHFKENIIKCSSSVIATCDLEGNMTYGNPTFLKTWGFDNPEEFLGKPFWKFWLVEDRLDEIMRALRDNGTWFGEIKAIRKDGAVFDVQVTAAIVFDSGGNPVALTSTSIDISKRMRTEEALRESEQRLRVAVKTAGLAIWDWDMAKNTVRWHNPWENMFDGPPEKERAYEWWAGRIHPEDRDAVISTFNDALAGGRESLVLEYRFRRTDGAWTTVYDRSHILRDKSGQAYRGIGAVMDVTGLRRVEEEIRRSRDELGIRVRERTAELAKANEALRHLSSKLLAAQEEERKRIGGELHDAIGSCLAGIKYNIESALLKSGNGATVPVESLTKVIPLVQEAMEECRRIQLALRPPMLDDLGLLPTLSWLSRLYQEIYKEIRIKKEEILEESDIPDFLKIVIYRITQEAMNNIAKHSKADFIRLCLKKNRGRIEFVLEDNGKGFDSEKVLGSESTRRGLGLTSMKERAEVSGGTFEIESREGKGTIIRVSWPLSPDR